MFTKDDIEEKYSSGTRDFLAANFEKADLKDIFLSRVDLSQANLNSANLKNADLSDANLTESSLVGAELNKAHLTGINLSKANLSNADFTESILTQANFTAACLEKASLMWAVLIEADLSAANLSGADLSDANLSGANLDSANLENVFYNSKTKFPDNFDPTSQRMVNKLSIEEFIAQFNHLCSCSNKYLGSIMTARNFNASRPNFDWLQQFTINKSSKIDYQGNPAEPIKSEHLQYFQQWLDAFIKSCSSVIKGFKKFV